MNRSKIRPFVPNSMPPDSFKFGLVIMGVQVHLNSDQKALLKSLCDSQTAQSYSQLEVKVIEARGENGDDHISRDNMRQIKLKVDRALRDAFPNSTGVPIERLGGERYGRFRLNRNWFIENVRRLNEENHSQNNVVRRDSVEEGTLVSAVAVFLGFRSTIHAVFSRT